MSVLIVDDIEENRWMIEALLEEQGFAEIKMVSSAQEAFDELGMDTGELREDIDCVVMDVRMDGIDGIVGAAVGVVRA